MGDAWVPELGIRMQRRGIPGWESGFVNAAQGDSWTIFFQIPGATSEFEVSRLKLSACC